MKSLYLTLLGIVAATFTGCAAGPHYHVEWDGPTPPPIVVAGQSAAKPCCPKHASQFQTAPQKTPCSPQNPCPPTTADGYRPQPRSDGTVSIGRFKLWNPHAPDLSGHWNGEAVPPKPETDKSELKTDWYGRRTRDYSRRTTREITPQITPDRQVVYSSRDTTEEQDHSEEHRVPASAAAAVYTTLPVVQPVAVYTAPVSTVPVYTAPVYATTPYATTQPYSGRYGTTPLRQW